MANFYSVFDVLFWLRCEYSLFSGNHVDEFALSKNSLILIFSENSNKICFVDLLNSNSGFLQPNHYLHMVLELNNFPVWRSSFSGYLLYIVG